MRLAQLEARFIKHLDKGSWHVVFTLAEADGIQFVCPKCYTNLGKREGAHSVICWFVGKVPDDETPGPGRWTPSGTGLEDLTFIPGDPPRAVSVLLNSGCGWHGHVLKGEATLT